MPIAVRKISALTALLIAASAVTAAALESVAYYSPRNCERPRRSSTRYIILHTTEGSKAGSLSKVYRGGETHFLIDTYGKVYRIIEADRVALHCGRSMWDGRANLDTCSIGIEMVGFHTADITPAQYTALAAQLQLLQAAYAIPDERVLTHSMVAYGAPNRWHPLSHRGRKRCGMLFARRSVRQKLGLTAQPLRDPDVAARRLVQADPYLAKVLYGDAREQAVATARFTAAGADVIGPGRSAWDIARDQCNDPSTAYVFPNGQRMQGNEIKDWNKLPHGTRVIVAESAQENPEEGVRRIGRDGATARDIAGAECSLPSTIFFLPEGKVRGGDQLTAEEIAAMPAGTDMLVGYVNAGYVTGKRSAYVICGKRWDFPSTVYRYPDGTFVAGNRVTETGIPLATMVFFRK